MSAMLTRRAVLAGSGAGLPLLAGAGAAAGGARIKLRLIETSDLHMFVADHDYYRDRPDLTVGLCRVASLIAAARAEAPNSLLFDNGDIIQGNPLGDFAARPGALAKGAVHPIFRAMNTLDYDAATVGNHEFNYGLDFLERALEGVRFPFVCANVTRAKGEAFLPPHLILERRLRAEDGSVHLLRIGVIGFVTPQIMVWDRAHLEGRLLAQDIVETAASVLPGLRARCDVVVGLCHSGISAAPRVNGFENAAFHLAGVAGFDAIFTGHSHRVFPGPDYAATAGAGGIDSTNGTLAGVPAVMPGFWGSHLGVIDLELAHDGVRWSVAGHGAAARPIYRREAGKVVALVEPARAITEEIREAHEATRVWVSQPVGRTARPLSTRFALAGDTSVMDFINAAQVWYARGLLTGTPHEAVPLLSAAAPFKAGFTPDAFIDLPAGPIAIRDLAEIYLFANTLSAVRITGAMVGEWLERSAAVFNRLDPALESVQPLVDRRVPSYNFDLISDLSWQFDLSQPVRHGAGGAVASDVRRVRDLRYRGAPIDPAAEFVVVTNNYRADGGGGFPGLDGSRTVLRAPDLNRDAMIRFVEAVGTVDIPPQSRWRFAGMGRPVKVSLDSAPEAAAAPSWLPGGRREGVSPQGFARFVFEIGG